MGDSHGKEKIIQEWTFEESGWLREPKDIHIWWFVACHGPVSAVPHFCGTKAIVNSCQTIRQAPKKGEGYTWGLLAWTMQMQFPLPFKTVQRPSKAHLVPHHWELASRAQQDQAVTLGSCLSCTRGNETLAAKQPEALFYFCSSADGRLYLTGVVQCNANLVIHPLFAISWGTAASYRWYWEGWWWKGSQRKGVQSRWRCEFGILLWPGQTGKWTQNGTSMTEGFSFHGIQLTCIRRKIMIFIFIYSSYCILHRVTAPIQDATMQCSPCLSISQDRRCPTYNLYSWSRLSCLHRHHPRSKSSSWFTNAGYVA